MVYRFRPDGRDPDNSVFDLIYLQPLPESGVRPDPAEPIELSAEQSFHDVPGLDPGLATIYDQDTGNLIAQQRGFKASTKAGATLANYQEARIRHLHQRIDDLSARDRHDDQGHTSRRHFHTGPGSAPGLLSGPAGFQGSHERVMARGQWRHR